MSYLTVRFVLLKCKMFGYSMISMQLSLVEFV